MRLFLHYKIINKKQHELLFTPMNVHTDMIEEDYVHGLIKINPSLKKLIKEFNLEL
jgi:hypothetical protein